MPYAWPHSLPSSHYHGGGYQRGGEKRTSDMNDMTISLTKDTASILAHARKKSSSQFPKTITMSQLLTAISQKIFKWSIYHYYNYI
jgi:hypothetical protein